MTSAPYQQNEMVGIMSMTITCSVRDRTEAPVAVNMLVKYAIVLGFVRLEMAPALKASNEEGLARARGAAALRPANEQAIILVPSHIR